MGARQFIETSKEAHKFSVGQFLVIGPGDYEMLHGHDYQVRTKLVTPQLSGAGFVVNWTNYKQKIADICCSLDERILVPEQNEHLACTSEGNNTIIKICDGEDTYSLPTRNLVPLPISNVTAEELANYFWLELCGQLRSCYSELRVLELAVTIAPSRGQSATFSFDNKEAVTFEKLLSLAKAE